MTSSMEQRLADLRRTFHMGDRVRARWTIFDAATASEIPEGSMGRVEFVSPVVLVLVRVRWQIAGAPSFLTYTENLDQVDA